MNIKTSVLLLVILPWCFVGCTGPAWQEYQVNLTGGISVKLSAPPDLVVLFSEGGNASGISSFYLTYADEGLSAVFCNTKYHELFSLSKDKKYVQIIEMARKETLKIETIATPSGEWIILLGETKGGIIATNSSSSHAMLFFFGSPLLTYADSIKVIKSIRWMKGKEEQSKTAPIE